MWISAKFSLEDGRFFAEGECIIRENENYQIVLMSNSPENEIDNLCTILFKDADKGVKYINGRYTLLMYNKKSHCLYCCQDFLCGLAPLYYTQKDGVIYLSTSLKKLLLSSEIKRKINSKAKRMFEIRNAVYNGNTLIKNVYKLQLQKALVISTQGIKLINNKFVLPPNILNTEGYSLSECESLWGDCLKNSIKSCVSQNASIAMPLSSGYDSNYILWSLAQNNQKQIHCYCVGGAKGINEISSAKEISQQYPSTVFSSTEVTSATFQSLPDILWRLEGSVYEQGVFLQYELAKAVAKAGESSVLCGEGSDEIFSDSFYRDLVNFDDNSSVFHHRRGNMYVWLAHYISRKSTLIMNSFGVKPSYPYSDISVVAMAKYVKEVSRKRGKTFHKDFCKKVFSPEVMKKINSVGGKTELTSLFKDDPYQELKNLKKREKIHFGLFLMLIDMYEIVRMCLVNIIKGHRYDITKEINQRYMNNVIVELYIKTFSEIYLTGKYDKYFNDTSFNITLDEIFDK